MLDRWHQLEGEIQQQEPYASKTMECMPQSLSSFLCLTDHFKIGLFLELKFAEFEQYNFQILFVFVFCGV